MIKLRSCLRGGTLAKTGSIIIARAAELGKSLPEYPYWVQVDEKIDLALLISSASY
jgi:hypothetical protein